MEDTGTQTVRLGQSDRDSQIQTGVRDDNKTARDRQPGTDSQVQTARDRQPGTDSQGQTLARDLTVFSVLFRFIRNTNRDCLQNINM